MTFTTNDENISQAETIQEDSTVAVDGDDLDQDTSADQAEQADARAVADAAVEAAEIEATVEAILFTSDSPISAAKIAAVASITGRKRVQRAIEKLNDRYDRMGCAFCIESIAGGYRMMTRQEYNDVLAKLLRVKSESRLSSAAMETLSIVAYRQPMIRADVESIRGVACGEMLRKLLDKQLVKIVGRADVIGRPMLYGTTLKFLEIFGLNSIDDLPHCEDLRISAIAAVTVMPPETPLFDAPQKTDVADTEDVTNTADPQELVEIVESTQVEDENHGQYIPEDQKPNASSE